MCRFVSEIAYRHKHVRQLSLHGQIPRLNVRRNHVVVLADIRSEGYERSVLRKSRREWHSTWKVTPRVIEATDRSDHVCEVTPRRLPDRCPLAQLRREIHIAQAVGRANRHAPISPHIPGESETWFKVAVHGLERIVAGESKAGISHENDSG